MNSNAWLHTTTMLVLIAGCGSSAWAGPHTSVSNTGEIRTAPASGRSGSPGVAGRLESGAASTLRASRPQSEVSEAVLQQQSQRYLPMPQPARSGSIQPESVLGADRRFRLYPKASGFPYRAIGQLTFDTTSGSYICSGWLISPDTVATAGHCVHSGGKGGEWSLNMVFTPGRNGGQMPFGSCNAVRLETVQGWSEDGDLQQDYGAVKLDCRIGEELGYLGLQVYDDARAPILVLGYPGDKTYGTLWGSAGEVAVSSGRRTFYKVDSAGGQSGGAVIRADGARNNDCQGICAIAIHTYGANSEGRNSGTRITQQVFDNFQLWINTP